MDRIGAAGYGLSASQNGFAVAIGGGIQGKISGHWAFRPTFDYVLSHHNIFGGLGVKQNNFRVGGGLVYTFGSAVE
jgi:hypothetical protein